MKTILVFVLFVVGVFSQLSFPAEETPGSNKPARQPVYAPGRCPENQWYWPGDKETDWVCDCASRFVYNPTTDKCEEVYRQGSCKPGEYLILDTGKVLPECMTNPCAKDETVPFAGNCYPLYKSDACPTVGRLRRKLNVNATSLKLECILDGATLLSNSINVGKVHCPAGSKRKSLGQC